VPHAIKAAVVFLEKILSGKHEGTNLLMWIGFFLQPQTWHDFLPFIFNMSTASPIQ